MEAKEIQKLIQADENQEVEFKSGAGKVGESICSFANTNNGIILMGVDDKGEITGCSPKDEHRIANIAQTCTPSIHPEIKELKVEGKIIYVVKVAKGDDPFYSYKNVVYKRVGTNDMPLSPEQVVNLARKSGMINFDEQACKGAELEDIDREKVNWYLDRREEIRQVEKPKELSFKKLLVNLNAAYEIGGTLKPTNAGILFFSANPQRFLVQSQLRLVKFKGTKLTNPVIDRFDCSGTLWEMIEQGEDFLRKTIRLLSERTDRSFRREDRFEYPLKALREGIINALIHRDYFEPADVRVMIFDDRIEIINPGIFPEGVTPEHPEHKPINPTLCSLMYDIGFIEKYGSGIYMMKELCSKWGNEEPTYDFGSTQTSLIFKSPVEEVTIIDIEEVTERTDLNERQLKALEYVQEKGKITNREYRYLYEVSNKTAYKELSDLVKKEILLQKGKGRSTYYVLR